MKTVEKILINFLFYWWSF